MADPSPHGELIADALASLAHDLKQPVRGIRRYAQFLADDYSDALDADGLKMLGSLERLSEQVERYITALLGQVSDDASELTVEDVDLNEVLGSVVELLGAIIADRHAEVSAVDVLPTIKTNRGLIMRVLLNLVSNGIQYNDRAVPRVEIGVESESSDAGQIECFVRDNGIGMDDSVAEALFESAVQRFNGGKYGAGLGIGLTISRHAVSRLGGRIWIESTPGVGSMVRFTVSVD